MIDQLKASIPLRNWRVHEAFALRLAAPELPTIDELKAINLPLVEMSTQVLSHVEHQVREDMATYLWNQEQNDLVQVFVAESARLAGDASDSEDWQKMLLALNALGLAQVATKLLHHSKSLADWAANARKHANVLTQEDIALIESIETAIDLATAKVIEASTQVGTNLDLSRQTFQDACDLVEGQFKPYQQFYVLKN
ncbi:MAG: hypothetical protein IPG59_11815 [Candidatus Melainabacteria bacterium]|nr:MAG: hypothetical protein IPG59_11815 [Candidatus Melainabacteria bacterium]